MRFVSILLVAALSLLTGCVTAPFGQQAFYVGTAKENLFDRQENSPGVYGTCIYRANYSYIKQDVEEWTGTYTNESIILACRIGLDVAVNALRREDIKHDTGFRGIAVVMADDTPANRKAFLANVASDTAVVFVTRDDINRRRSQRAA